MRDALRRRIDQAITLAEKAVQSPEAYGYLPDIIQSLRRMRRGLRLPPKSRGKIAGALGRLVTDSFAFSESPLGGRLLKLADDFASLPP